jgi:hypothetical protein
MREVRWLVRVAGIAAAVVAVGAAGAADVGNGLMVRGWTAAAQPSGSAFASSSFSSRLSFSLDSPTGLPAAAMSAASPAIVSARLLGDYYFGRPATGEGRAGGFRATSGLLFGPRLGAWAAAPAAAPGAATVSLERRDFGLLPGTLGAMRRGDGSAAVPYVGFGYSDAFGDKGRWGVSADLGLMALRQQAGGIRLGRAPGGGPGADDTLREMRLAPLLQLGVSYSF